MKDKRPKSLSQRLINQKTAPWIFVAPFIISFCLFTVYPLISTVIMSFQDIAGFDDVEFIGLKNYKNLNNQQFYHALENSTIYTILTIIVLIPLPMVLAVLINSKTTKLKNLFKSSFFLPALTSVVVAGIFFRYLFSEQETALINSIIKTLGGTPKKWLFKRTSAMFVLVLFCTWKWIGVNMIYFLSGLNAIPQEQYEAADIDGASTWQQFWYITVPNLKNVTIYVVTISIYGGFSMFGETYTIFGSAASPGDIGLTMVSYIYLEGFNYARLGMGSAIGVALFAIIMIINIIQLMATNTTKKEQ